MSHIGKSAMRKRELFEEFTREQKKRTVLGEKGVAYSRFAYNYWVNSREKQWVISGHEGILELTALGKWIANSALGTFFERDDFVDLTCSKCRKPGDLVLLKPLPHTAETNAKGTLFMDFQCPRCSFSLKRMGVSEVLLKEEFITFYNEALRELDGIVKGQPL